MSQVEPARLMIVDDEAPQMQALRATLQSEGYAAYGFTSPREALAALRRENFDLMLTDLAMPELDGLGLLRAAAEIDSDLVVILMTGHGTIDTAVAAMKAGALDYILKPFKLSAILPVLERALAVRKLRRENAVLARRVVESTEDLNAANKELEAFSYSISHDLRAPLRHIDGFAGLLLERFSENLPEEAKRHLNTISGSVQRMKQLIDDLLKFSRLSRQAISRQPVDLAALARTILEELKKEHPDRKIQIQVDDLPLCTGDPSLLRQVLVNLLSNAFKFTGKAKAARVEVGWRKEGDQSIYFVKDNGAGFDMKYADRLFGVFQRLHKSDEFEGTGVGLSIVQRIIHRHGGRIWVQAALNQGATFNFTLPVVA